MTPTSWWFGFFQSALGNAVNLRWTSSFFCWCHICNANTQISVKILILPGADLQEPTSVSIKAHGVLLMSNGFGIIPKVLKRKDKKYEFPLTPKQGVKSRGRRAEM